MSAPGPRDPADRPDPTGPPDRPDPPALRALVSAHLRAFVPTAVPLDGRRPASVALCVVLAGPERVPSLLITRRAPRMRAHAGQWALPGGRREPGESVPAAALRELAEETGVALGADAVLGRLDDYPTRSGYVMSPVVVWAGETDGVFQAQEAEVARVHVVPLADLDVAPELLRIPESDAPVIRLPLLGGWVHAPTAAVVHQFTEVALHGRPTPVAHLEQPVFAWR